jgi:3-deoxy-manno-octulosonate cytidylyltransferase (CMP-KDO synthetase)
MDSRRVLCVIPARYGSTRLPAKALAEVRGVPLVMWTFNAARRSGAFDRVLVATDDKRIADTVERSGGEAVMTSAEHHSGTDRVLEAAGHTKHPYVVNLQADEPEVPGDLLVSFSRTLLQRAGPNSLLTCVTAALPEEVGDPDTVKVVMNGRGQALYFSRAAIPHARPGRSSEYVKHTGIYGFTRESLTRFCALPPGKLERAEGLEQLRALENGMVIHCMLHSFPTFGIDTPEDLARFRERVEARRDE